MLGAPTPSTAKVLDAAKLKEKEINYYTQDLRDKIADLEKKLELLLADRKKKFRWVESHWELVDE